MIWGDHIFVTSVISAADQEPPKPGLYFGGERPAPTAEHRWMVYAIEFSTGRIRWEREVHRARPATSRHLKNSYASETPVTDGTRVYAYFGNVGLFVFDMNGTPLWSKDFGTVNMRNGWGTAASPVLHRDRLYIVNDNDTQSFLAAFDASSGREIWRVTRDERSNWATPFVWEHEGSARDRHIRLRQSTWLRSRGRPEVGTERHVVDYDSDAVCRTRPAVCFIGLRRRRAASDVRDPSRCGRRHLAETR